jgi:hypothetical protein
MAALTRIPLFTPHVEESLIIATSTQTFIRSEFVDKGRGFLGSGLRGPLERKGSPERKMLRRPLGRKGSPEQNISFDILR